MHLNAARLHPDTHFSGFRVQKDEAACACHELYTCSWMFIKSCCDVFPPSHVCHCEFLFPTENAAEKELRGEDADDKDPGEFLKFPRGM